MQNEITLLNKKIKEKSDNIKHKQKKTENVCCLLFSFFLLSIYFSVFFYLSNIQFFLFVTFVFLQLLFLLFFLVSSFIYKRIFKSCSFEYFSISTQNQILSSADLILNYFEISKYQNDVGRKSKEQKAKIILEKISCVKKDRSAHLVYTTIIIFALIVLYSFNFKKIQLLNYEKEYYIEKFKDTTIILGVKNFKKAKYFVDFTEEKDYVSDSFCICKFENVVNNFSFHLCSGIRKSQKMKMCVFNNPKLTNVCTKAFFPKYTHFTDTTFFNTKKIVVPQGTKLSVSCETVFSDSVFYFDSIKNKCYKKNNYDSLVVYALDSSYFSILLCKNNLLLKASDLIILSKPDEQPKIDFFIDTSNLYKDKVVDFDITIYDDYGFSKLLFISESDYISDTLLISVSELPKSQNFISSYRLPEIKSNTYKFSFILYDNNTFKPNFYQTENKRGCHIQAIIKQGGGTGILFYGKL